MENWSVMEQVYGDDSSMVDDHIALCSPSEKPVKNFRYPIPLSHLRNSPASAGPHPSSIVLTLPNPKCPIPNSPVAIPPTRPTPPAFLLPHPHSLLSPIGLPRPNPPPLLQSPIPRPARDTHQHSHHTPNPVPVNNSIVGQLGIDRHGSSVSASCGRRPRGLRRRMAARWCG